MTERRHPQSRRPVKSAAARIAEFFEELDGRIDGRIGTHSPESRSQMATHRPLLVTRARKDPYDFAAELDRRLSQMRVEGGE